MYVLKIYKTFWRRFWAGLIDAIIFWVFGFVGMIKFIGTTSHLVLGLWYAFGLLGPLIYSIVLHGLCGQTVGKMVTKVTVVDITGRRLSMKQAIYRDSPYLVLAIFGFYATVLDYIAETPMMLQSLVEFLSFAWFLIEIISMLTNRKRRAVHDFIAESVVIRSDERTLEEFGSIIHNKRLASLDSITRHE